MDYTYTITFKGTDGKEHVFMEGEDDVKLVQDSVNMVLIGLALGKEYSYRLYEDHTQIATISIHTLLDLPYPINFPFALRDVGQVFA